MFKLNKKTQGNSLAQLRTSALFVLLLSYSFTFAQTPDSLKQLELQQVTISATMAGNKTPMSFTNIKREQIRQNDFGQDIPFLLKARHRQLRLLTLVRALATQVCASVAATRRVQM